MEEMQKAFNKTIIKLQNTSRVAEEQVRHEGASVGLVWNLKLRACIRFVFPLILCFIKPCKVPKKKYLLLGWHLQLM